MATFAPTRPVPAGAFFCRFAAAANLGLSWCRSAPIALVRLWWLGMKPRPGMSGPFFIASVHASFGEYPEEFFRACLRPSLAVSRPRGDFTSCELLALGSGKPDEGSTLNQVPDTKGCATGCRFRCRNLITIKCADCRICSALWVELLQRYFSRILTGDRAFLAGVMCRDESRYRSV